jgi:hypothetical protein
MDAQARRGPAGLWEVDRDYTGEPMKTFIGLLASANARPQRSEEA